MKKFFGTTLALLLLSYPAVAQQPTPSGSGPTLAVTMQFLQEKLGGQGQIRFAQHELMSPSGDTWDSNTSIEVTSVRASPQACSLKYHFKQIDTYKDPNFRITNAKGKVLKAGAPIENEEHELVLSTVIGIHALAAGEYLSDGVQATANGVAQTVTFTTDPPVFVVTVQTPEKLKKVFFFPDQQIAERVGKAMQHAVDLCKPPTPPARDDSRKPNEPF